MRKVSSRNQRSKGIKAKHVLQICVLLGVCIWLIYQVKYSHDKKKEFEEKDKKLSKISQSEDGNIKLGRKDLRSEHKVSKSKRHEEEEEEEEEADETVIEEESAHGDEEIKHDDELEVEGNTKKHEEDEQEEEEVEEEENKDVEKDVDGREKETSKDHEDEDEQEEEKENKHGEEDDDERETEDDDVQNGGNEGIDEQDQGKTGETGREDEFIDEGKDREEKEDDDEESESNGQLQSKDNHEEVGRSTHEAREENYKADDASSAVSHEDEPTNSESVKVSLDNSDRNLDTAGTFLANETESNNAEGKTQSGTSANTTSNEEKDQGNIVSDVKSIREFGGHRDARNIIEVKAERNNNWTVNLEISGSDSNGTRSVLDDLSLAWNTTEVAQTSMDAARNPEIAKPSVTSPANTQTSDILTGQSSNMSSYSVSSLPDEMKNLNSTAEAGENPESSSKNDNMQNLESLSHSLINQTTDTVENDPIDASDNLISHEVKALTDPDTLPDLKAGVDIAAE